jgi:hypothetical protein
MGRQAILQVSDAVGSLDLRFDRDEGDEVEIYQRDVSLCLLINRRTKVMRVIDFRAGSQASKFDLIFEAAEREGITRAFTVVEREEATTWAKMGFEKEGTIPSFYKRSDGHLLGIQFDVPAPKESGTRIRIRRDEAPSEDRPSSDRGERAYQAGRRLARSGQESATRVKVAPAKRREAEKAFAHAVASGRALSGMEHFGRGTDRSLFLCTARGGFSLLVGVEPQPCFDNAFIEVLSAPRGEKEAWLTAVALERICSDFLPDNTTSVFALGPVESVELTAAWVKAGFRRSGRLLAHLQVHGRSSDAFVWARRLGEPV